jgi:hypothetical protein
MSNPYPLIPIQPFQYIYTSVLSLLLDTTRDRSRNKFRGDFLLSPLVLVSLSFILLPQIWKGSGDGGIGFPAVEGLSPPTPLLDPYLDNTHTVI